jgi:hypothetical protein
VRKTLIPTVLFLFYFLSLKDDAEKKVFCRSLEDPLIRGTDPDPDPYQNVNDPQSLSETHVFIETGLRMRV